MTLRQQSQLLWHMYFSSIDRIIFTTLEVKRAGCIKIRRRQRRAAIVWFLLVGPSARLFRLPHIIFFSFFFLKIVRQRVHKHLWRDGRVWNSFPGGLVTLPEYADSPSRLPWNHLRSEQAKQHHHHLEAIESSSVNNTTVRVQSSSSQGQQQFTALIYAQQPMVGPTSSGPLLHLLRVVSRSQHVARVNNNISLRRCGCVTSSFFF